MNSVLPHTHLSIDTIYNFKTKHLLENISPVIDECLHDSTVAMAGSNVQSCVLLIVHDLYSSTYHCIMVNNWHPQSNVTTYHGESVSQSSNKSHVWRSYGVQYDHPYPTISNIHTQVYMYICTHKCNYSSLYYGVKDKHSSISSALLLPMAMCITLCIYMCLTNADNSSVLIAKLGWEG